MVAYVQQLGRQGASEPSHGRRRGRRDRLRRRTAARSATRIDGQGGFLGPDLTDIGARRAVRHLRQSIVDPSADIPLDYRSVSVTDRKGNDHQRDSSQRGRILRPSARPCSGNLRSFMKSELKEIKLPRQSLMPAYARSRPTIWKTWSRTSACDKRGGRVTSDRHACMARRWQFWRADARSSGERLGGLRCVVDVRPAREHRRPQNDRAGRAQSHRFAGRQGRRVRRRGRCAVHRQPSARGRRGVHVGSDLPARRRREGAALVSPERAGSRDRRRHRQPDALRDPGRRRQVVSSTATTSREPRARR